MPGFVLSAGAAGKPRTWRQGTRSRASVSIRSYVPLEIPVSFYPPDTEKAIRVIDHRTGEVLWLPKSQTKVAKGMGFDATGGRTGVAIVSDWLAGEKGLR